MKKHLLLSLLLIFFIYYPLFTIGQPNAYPTDEIGTTWYDLQTNRTIQNRIHVFDDGTIGAVWTMGFDYYAFPERGTGYNYFDVENWQPQPTERIEDVRTGWPSYAPFGENGEIIVAHKTNIPEGLYICTRMQKGENDWNFSSICGPTGHEGILWPKMITSGENNEEIHILIATKPPGNGGFPYFGQDIALLYYRSKDYGQTWDIEHHLFPELDSSNYLDIPYDGYIWAKPQGDTLAFMVASRYMDMVVMKSYDDGDSWEKTIVWQHPYPFYSTWYTITLDTVFCCDGASAILLDNSGKVHIAFGIDNLFHPEIGNPYCFIYPEDAIGYWNEDMPVFQGTHRSLHPDSLLESGNLIGWSQDINGNGQLDFLDDIQTYRTRGISSMPYLALNEEQNIFLVYSSITELYDNGTLNFRHIWMRSSFDGGNTWGEFYDLTYNLATVVGEFIYPVLTCNKYGDLKLFCQMDDIPGLALDEDHPYHENQIWCIDLNEFTPPHADFIADTVVIHIDNSVNFTNLSEPANSFYWEFEGGEPSVFEEETPPAIFYNETGEYYVKLTISKDGLNDYELKEKYIKVIDYTAINENKSEKIILFPNPSKGNFTIQINRNIQNGFDIIIYDILGTIVYKQNSTVFNKNYKYFINIPNLSEGLYFLEIKTLQGNISKKFVIRK